MEGECPALRDPSTCTGMPHKHVAVDVIAATVHRHTDDQNLLTPATLLSST